MLQDDEYDDNSNTSWLELNVDYNSGNVALYNSGETLAVADSASHSAWT